MRRESEPAVIQEPAFREIEKRTGSCLKGSCGALAFFGVLFIALVLLVERLSAEPKAKAIATLPRDFPTDIPLFRFEDRSGITLLAAEDKARREKTVAPFRRTLIPPLLAGLKPLRGISRFGISANRVPLLRRIPDLEKALSAPADVSRNETALEWEKLNAGAGEVEAYYQNTMLERGFAVGRAKEYNHTRTFAFEKGAIRGSMEIADEDRNDEKIDKVTLKVKYL